VAGTVDEIGETTYELKTTYEKVGTEEEEVWVGSHQEKIGTKKVWVGSHQEKIGTRQVVNPEKRWWKIFTPRFVDEDIFETVNEYKDEDVYQTVNDYKTVIRDVFEERTETVKKYRASTVKIQQELVSRMRRNLDDGITDALQFAEKQVQHMKKEFSAIFAVLDGLIASKYEELENYARDQSKSEARLAENQKILEWIEEKTAEIEAILDME
jgi:predicted choloylglycine hydrolase